MKRWLPAVLVVLSALILVLGIIWDGARAVWQKAATICLECIGIG